MEAKLSIIVPVYNVEPYLDRCVESIINQIYRNIEIILVDDGSTDQSGDLCDKWRESDSRVIVIHKKNGGLSSARNTGIKAATGDYLGFVDSDDFIEADMYSKMMNAVTECGKEIACCGRMVHLDGQGTKLKFYLKDKEVFDKEAAIKEVLLLNKIDVSSCDKVFKKKLFNEILYPEGRISEDAAIIFQILSASNGVVHIGGAYYHYVFRKDSISKSSYTHKAYDDYLNCVAIGRFIAENYACLQKESTVYCTQVAGALLQKMYKDKSNFIKYKADYIEYRRMFIKGFWTTMFQNSIHLKIKIKLFLVYIHLYPLFLKWKKFKKIWSHDR